MKQELTFSGRVKEELSRQWNEQKHCQIAEIAAIISMCGKVTIDSRDRYAVKVRTENISVARKCFTLLEKTFNIEAESLVTINKSKGNTTYTVVVKQHEDAMKLLQAARLVDGDGEISEEFSTSRNMIVHKSCCKRAFLRGAFLASGSMSHPEKSYHIEMVCASKAKAEQIQKLPLLTNVNLTPENGSSALSLEDVKHLMEVAPNVVFDFSFDFYGETLSTADKEVHIKNKKIGGAFGVVHDVYQGKELVKTELRWFISESCDDELSRSAVRLLFSRIYP